MDKINLSKSYDIDSHRRANTKPVEWKQVEREGFLSKLLSSDKKKLLEIGYCPGAIW